MPDKQKTILLVEDEAIIALNETAVLKKHGFRVVSAYSAEAAVKAVRDNPIDLVLMDIDLGAGEMDGTEAAETILREYELPIVFLTSHAEKEYVDKVKNITGSGYILKDSGEFVLIESIHMAFNLFETKLEAQHHLRETELRESRLEHLNRVLLSIRNVNQIITKETDTKELLDKTCRLLIETSGYEQAWIVLLKDGKPREPYFHAGFSGRFGPMTDFLNSGKIPECAAAALKKGRLRALAQSTADCGSCPFQNLNTSDACAEAAKTVLTAKLEHAGILQGWISVLVPKLYADNRDDRRLFEEIAGDISYALQSITVSNEIIETKELLENTMNAIPDAIGVLDDSFNVIRYNSAGYRLLGKTSEEVQGRKCYELLGRTDPCEICAVQKSYTSKNTEQVYRYEQDLDIWVDLRAYPILDKNGNVVKIIEHFRDITAQKEVEDDLRITLKSIGDAVISTDLNGRVTRINPVAEKLTGWNTSEAAGKKLEEVFRIIHEKSGEFLENPVGEVIRTGKTMGLSNHTKLISKTGEQYHIADSAAPIQSDEGKIRGVVLVFRDVSDEYEKRRELQESKDFLNAVFQSIQDGISVLNTDLTIRYINPVMERWYAEEMPLIGKKCYTCYQDLDSPCEPCPTLRCIRSGTTEFEIRPGSPDTGSPIVWLELFSYPIKNTEAGTVTGVVEFVRDITARKKAEQEKDFLMKELNHRVKNNLAMITSLINLKNAALGEEIDLSDIQHQIDAFRIVHEKLYASRDITEIDFSDYISDLLATIFSSYPRLAVHIEKNIETGSIPTKTAIPLGLIINEAATNAVKHGFNSDTVQPVFSIGMQNSGSEYVLSIANNGNPFPADIGLDNPQTLGLQLISALVEQISATIELQRGPHPEFTIRFPVKKIE